MNDTYSNGRNASRRFENTLYSEIVKPNLKMIKEMIELGLGDKMIYDTLGISASTWHKYKYDEDLALVKIYKESVNKRVKEKVDQAKKLIAVVPTKAELAEVMLSVLYEKDIDKLTVKDIDMAWNRLYPEDNWFKTNLEERTEIARHEAETKRLALNNMYVDNEETGSLLNSFFKAFDEDIKDNYDDLLDQYSYDTYNYEEE